MKKRAVSLVLALLLALSLLPASVMAAVDDESNGDWTAKALTLKNTAEAELMVRVGDIDALNDEATVEESGYDPFTAASQYSHSYPWVNDEDDPAGTDRIFVGSKWTNESTDGYSSNYLSYKAGEDKENAYGDGALEIALQYDAAGLTVQNALLQLCIDDFQALSWKSNFTVTINGKDAPFIAELLNHVDQTGPTAYVISAIIPSSFYADVASGSLTVTIDETTGCGDGYAVDFAKLLINYKKDVFKGTFTGTTEPGATVRLLGTSTTVKASSTGGFEFEAAPGLNAVRASLDGYVEGYDYGIVFAQDAVLGEDDVKWEPNISLEAGQGSADIDFSQFGVTAAWEHVSDWAEPYVQHASELDLIPECLKGQDLSQPINRQEFAAVSVKVYEAMAGVKAEPAAVNPFTDCDDAEVLKAYALGVTRGTAADKFSPAALLTREQAATMLTNTYKKFFYPAWTPETNDQFTLEFTKGPDFADHADISDWARSSVYFMAANGIIAGMGGNIFAPRATTSAQEAAGYGQATREQALVIAGHMIDNLCNC